MPEMSNERTEARSALTAIVSDPAYGAAALSNPRTMSNLLKDLLPDAPREKTVLVAAAEAGLAETLRDHVAQGLDSATAVRLTASRFSANTSFTPDACNWVTSEFAIALGISDSAPDPVNSPPGPGYSPPPAVYPPPAPTQFPPGQAQFPPGQAQFPPGQAQFPTGPMVSQPGPPQFQPGPAAYSPPGPAQYSPGPTQYSPPGPAQYSPGFGQPQPIGYGQPPVTGPRRNNLAVASLICGIVQFPFWILIIPEVLAVIFGLVAIRQIKQTGESGQGMAVAGVVLGALGLLAIIAFVIVSATTSTQTG